MKEKTNENSYLKDIGLYHDKNMFTSLTKEVDEITMLREMLKMKDTLVINNSIVQIDAYIEKERQFMKKRLYDLLYKTTEIPKDNYEQT